jgi:hypothetical protein
VLPRVDGAFGFRAYPPIDSVALCSRGLFGANRPEPQWVPGGAAGGVPGGRAGRAAALDAQQHFAATVQIASCMSSAFTSAKQSCGARTARSCWHVHAWRLRGRVRLGAQQRLHWSNWAERTAAALKRTEMNSPRNKEESQPAPPRDFSARTQRKLQ